jgi:TPR repeat protein
MERVEKTVFISYRRTDEPWGLAVFQDLTHHGYDVFIDYDGIASGNFETAILENIRARAHFLVLLTPTALERCGDPNDWMRREIEAALESQRNIVPLMFEGFDFGTPTIANKLTGKLAALKEYNGLPIPKGYFSSAMERLRNKFLNVQVDAVLHPASVSAQQVAKEQKDKATTALGDKDQQPKAATASIAVQWRKIAGGAAILGVVAIVLVAIFRLGPSVPVPQVPQAALPLTAEPAPSATSQSLSPVTPQDASAMNSEGERYYYGQGVAQDYAKARELWEKAADQDNASAMYNLGVLHLQGRGGEQDLAMARVWFLRAAAKGNTLAMDKLGVLYEQGRGGEQDYAAAREWYQKAADTGDASAMNDLGGLYEHVQGVAQDYAKAREWFEKAAAKGNALAMTNLGQLYQNGQGGAQDYAKAREWYQNAANKGNVDAKERLSQLPRE